MISNQELIRKAKSVSKQKRVSDRFQYGGVGCALVTDKGRVYLGTCIDTACGLGFCAEHSAIASMVAHGEHRVKKIVAVSDKGKVLPPCGRCRELMHQLNGKNPDIVVIIGKGREKCLGELLPEPWS